MPQINEENPTITTHNLVGLGNTRILTIDARNQCSRVKPSHEFHFGGLSNFNPLVEGLVQIQDVNLKNIEMKF